MEENKIPDLTAGGLMSVDGQDLDFQKDYSKEEAEDADEMIAPGKYITAGLTFRGTARVNVKAHANQE